jgi:uncharacterized membrane protein
MLTALKRSFPHVSWWIALVLWWASVHPTLMPRTSVTQGLISAVAIGLGLMVGSLVHVVVAVIATRTGRSVPTPLGGRGGLVLAVAWAVVGVVGVVLWHVWQNDQRALVGLEPVGAATIVPMVVVTAVVTVLFIVIGRLVGMGVRRVHRGVTRVVPAWLAVASTVVIVALVVWTLAVTVVGARLLDAINAAYSTIDDGTEPGVEPTTSDLRSGGPGSLVTWESLGEQGRTFVATGPTVAQLQDFADAGTDTAVGTGAVATAIEPIRTYVGLQAADTPETQADLAVAELERTGAFGREVLVVVTVTGTGWVNPAAAAGLEYLFAGDTAMVATQYSYLPSWISFLVDLDKAAESSRTLLTAVQQRWAAEPVETRPRLVVYGESLGSFGSESSFTPQGVRPTVDDVTSMVDGAMWVGPTFNNPLWNRMLDDRSSSNSAWYPGQDPPTPVRILGAPDEDPPIPHTTDEGRIVYLTHPSDPVTWASISSLWWRPVWMHRPTGYDVPNTLRWMPGVTFVQNVVDLMAGFSAPPGHGHDYVPNIADGWVATVAPDGWTDADTLRLRAVLDTFRTDA